MQAEVWKREQEKAHEERKLEEMKKEIAEERKMQELTDQAAEAGHVQKVERLEFMYKGGPMTSEDQDAYLLGEKKYEPPKEENELEKVSAAPGALLADAVGSKNETWNKLNADPLLMMRMQEQEARKNVTQNPIKMAQIKREVAALREKKKQKKREKKAMKKAKKKAKKPPAAPRARRRARRGAAPRAAAAAAARATTTTRATMTSRRRSRGRAEGARRQRRGRGRGGGRGGEGRRR